MFRCLFFFIFINIASISMPNMFNNNAGKIDKETIKKLLLWNYEKEKWFNLESDFPDALKALSQKKGSYSLCNVDCKYEENGDHLRQKISCELINNGRFFSDFFYISYEQAYDAEKNNLEINSFRIVCKRKLTLKTKIGLSCAIISSLKHLLYFRCFRK